MAEIIYETIKDVDGVECYIKRGEVVRCRDCKHWDSEREERCKELKTEPFGWCCRMRNMHEISYREITQHKDFCSYGERKDSGS